MLTPTAERAAAASPGLDWRYRLARHHPRLLADPEGRREACRFDVWLFALVYFRAHLSSAETGNVISFSRFHADFYDRARQWARTDLGPKELREAWVAPRGSAKSTMAFLIGPAWALAYGHRRYVAAFADSGPQAAMHLASLKREFDSNALLRRDFPMLCAPARRAVGTTVSDSQTLYVAESGAVFQARGVDSSTLGAKFGSQRPDLLLFDDLEPPASTYSPYQKEKRQATMIDAVFGMNDRAAAVLVGTTTMFGSIMHDVVRQVTDPDGCPSWVAEENIRTRYYPAIITEPDGTEASLWPERWSLPYLQSIRHTRSYALNMLNQPVSAGGDYWAASDFRSDVPAGVTRVLLSIDPAVTAKAGSSDFTGLAVVGYSPSEGRCVVRYTAAVRLPPGGLRAHVLKLIGDYDVGAVLIENNGTGDVWPEILSPLPCKLATIHQSEPKPVRASRALSYYQSGWVSHDGPQPAFEQQACAYPNVANDDVIDAVGTAVHHFLADRKRPRRTPSTTAYV